MTKPKRRPRTPWDKLARAGDKGSGIRLTANEVAHLNRDLAIVKRAEIDAYCYDQGHNPYTCQDCEEQW